MSEILKRSITGAIFVIIIVFSILFNSITFFFLFLLITYFCLNEFYELCDSVKIRVQKLTGISIGLLLYIYSFLFAINLINIKHFIIFFPITIIVFIIELYRNKRKPISSLAFTFLGLILIAIPFSLLIHIVLKTQLIIPGTQFLNNNSIITYDILDKIINHFDKYNSQFLLYSPNKLLGIFILIWTFDTAAYLVGITFGKKKLFLRISPKKSWEGLAGGAFFSIGMACFLSLFFKDLKIINWIIISIIIIIVGTYGDLVESLLKRSFEVKDSSNILPGHGGFLDRFDSFLFSIPIIFTYLEI